MCLSLRRYIFSLFGDVQELQDPPDRPFAKIFLRTDVDQLVNELSTVTSLGDATVEEWLKGLDVRQKQRWYEPSQWEKWAVAGGLSATRSSITPGFPAMSSLTDSILATLYLSPLRRYPQKAWDIPRRSQQLWSPLVLR